MSVLIEVRDVSKNFRPPVARPSLVKWMVSKPKARPTSTILNSVNLTVNAGECVGILGRNGSGKSTLLKIIAGIFQPTTGTIIAHGELLPMFSWENCFLDDLDVSDNLNLLGTLVGLSTRELKNVRDEILATAGLTERLDDQLRSFSPGMKARLALALADKTSAKIMLLDETLSAGDSNVRANSEQMLLRWKAQGRAIVHVSHDPELIRRLSDRCVVLDKGTLREANSGEFDRPSS